MDEQLRKAAHEYHRLPTPGKIAVVSIKSLINPLAKLETRRLVNMTALTVAGAGGQRGEQKPLL